MNHASTFAPLIDQLFITVSIVLSLVFCGVVVAMIYLGRKYRAGSEADRSAPPKTSLKLETAWTLPTLIIFGVFFIKGVDLFSRSRAPTNISEEIFVIAKQWMWKFQYKDGRREIADLYVPAGKKIRLLMISEDVIHSFFVPAFRIKQDVLPERYTSLVFQSDRPGTYDVLCTQYCGVRHSRMLGRVHVLNEKDYMDWKQSFGTTLGADEKTTDSTMRGKKLFQKYGCSMCHSSERKSEDKDMIGPNLWGIFGKRVDLANGESVLADEDYIHESVFEPKKKIVKGFKPVMVSFKGNMTEEEFRDLLSYIKSLGPEKK